MSNTKPRIIREFKCETYHEKVLSEAYQAAQEEIEDLKASIAHQEEILSYIQKVPTEPNEKALAKRVVELEAKVARYEGALNRIVGMVDMIKNPQMSYSSEEIYASKIARQALGEK